MYKILNIFFLITILIFLAYTYKYYSSNKNLITKEFNRDNIDSIINEKTSNLGTLMNDTNNIIEFNNSILKESTNNKPRSFWNLLKSK